MMSGRQVQDNEKRDLVGHVLFQDDHQELLLQNHY